MSQQGTQSQREATRVRNLCCYRLSDTYFARLEIRGKSIRLNLETTAFSVAQLRWPDAIKESLKIEESRQRLATEK